MPLKSPSKNVDMIFFLNQVSIANKVKFQFLSMTFKDLHDLGPKITSHIIPPWIQHFTHDRLWIYLRALFQESCSLRLDLSAYYILCLLNEMLLILSSNTTSYVKFCMNF